jgi:hypothetical protein
MIITSRSTDLHIREVRSSNLTQETINLDVDFRGCYSRKISGQ